MADLVGDRPAGARCRQLPLLVVEPGDDVVERLLFGEEIGEYVGHVGGVHAAQVYPIRRAACASEPVEAAPLR